MSTTDPAVHPFEIVPPEWVLSQQSLRAGRLEVRHQIEAPSEISVPALSHHFLSVVLSHGNTRQVTRLGRQHYEGAHAAGNFWLAAAQGDSAHWAWESTDETILFAIDPLSLQDLAQESGWKEPNLDLKHVLCGNDPIFERLAWQYRAEMQQPGLGGLLYCESLGNLFLLHLLRNYCHQSPKFRKYATGLGDRRLKRVLAYIDEHLEDSIGLQELAAVAELSQCHFCDMFKQFMGVPPYRYVLLQRIERAKRYLRQGKQPIQDIALDCGFADQSHLTRHFRKVVGLTPRAFREL
ncbi:helix-turn-helix transcriptional regulator [Nodosilinea sp. LEGE 07088]|uniref:helix-turn-helix domain-containing protein n=1 Tax=Nodosilinea sp. LEGE 07088 TaxID=2777968 RepID=UPI00187FE0EC|nr:AraC family transcriptional regulator [Nodosilinea sp. LEGE 07088]MBE9138659.1 helix-turn-helix transcriptional regulator [Nodosilinea sp. LEGE 07088]